MGRVKLLDKHTAELIAAGEVVDRPASIVKELVENSIDAGATAVTVEIKSGGIRYIRITDDGDGIAFEDVPTAFLRHATSKISVEEDLDAIATLGFRGEALASVCAVSRVELVTRASGEDIGTHYVIEGGEQLVYDECGCAKGTTIIVRDVFYNTPARMKFLKKDVAEGNAIAAIIDRLALSHPEVSFRFVREGKEVLMTSGDGKLGSAVFSVFGKEFTSELIPLEFTENTVKVYGFISKPACARPNRTMQIFFINGRFCRSRTMQTALEEAYKGKIMVGKHPACVMFVEMSCSAVDVNVHPTKLEVRFTSERPVFDGVYYAVKSALSEGDSRREIHVGKPSIQNLLMPPEPDTVQMKLNDAVKQNNLSDITAKNTAAKPILDNHKADNLYSLSGKTVTPAAVEDDSPLPPKAAKAAEMLPSENFIPQTAVHDTGSYVYPERPAVPSAPKLYPSAGIDVEADDLDELPARPVPEWEKEPLTAEPEIPDEVETAPSVTQKENVGDYPSGNEQEKSFVPPAYKIIGEAFGTYIVLEAEDELILIDKHAAHERLIYERLIKNTGGREPQLLLEPVTVTLDKPQYEKLLDNRDMLLERGFEIDDFGPGTVVVRSIPAALTGGDISGTVLEIAGNLGVKKDALTTSRTENMYHTIACRSAIKAHDRTLEPELAALVLELAANPDVRYCPHGRPIFMTLTKREIEKSFGRIQ